MSPQPPIAAPMKPAPTALMAHGMPCMVIESVSHLSTCLALSLLFGDGSLLHTLAIVKPYNCPEQLGQPKSRSIYYQAGESVYSQKGPGAYRTRGSKRAKDEFRAHRYLHVFLQLER